LELRLHRYYLKLEHVFTISRGSVDVQETLVAELRHAGLSGFGEATTNDYYNSSWDTMVAALHGVRGDLDDRLASDPESLWDRVHPALADCPFAQCALDQAAQDLAGKLAGKRVYERWGETLTQPANSCYTIGIDTPMKMVEKLRAAPGWPIYKIKLGTSDDLQLVRALREQTDAIFRVDANCAWEPSQAVEMSHSLKELNVEFIEQPLAAHQWDGMRKVYHESVLPIIADESCVYPADVRRCHGYFHGVNVKAVKCGGITPARRMLQEARSLGLQTMIGCMTESTVGISAIAQLLPYVDYADIDGAALLASDIADGVRVEHGVCHFSPRAGTGVVLTAPAAASSLG